MPTADAFLQIIYQFVAQMKSSIFLHVLQDVLLLLFTMEQR